MELLRPAAEPPIGRGTSWPAGARGDRRTLLAAAATVGALVAALLAVVGTASHTAAPPAATHAGLSSLPLGARGVASATLGAADRSYLVSSSPGGATGANPAQRLRLRFTRAGAEVSGSAGTVRLGLHSTAWGGTWVPVSPVLPRVEANRVVYRHAGISEWYANGPLGLEQGFAVARPRPGRQAGSLLTLSMSLSGAAPALADGGKTLILARWGAAQLRYTDLLATDARGRILPSRMELRGGRLLLSVDTRGARYPLRIDPLVQQGPKLVGNDQSGEGGVGEDVSLSADGNTALVGGPYDSGKPGSGLGVGAAWVFTRTGETWTQQGPKLVGLEEQGEGDFGTSVAVSADGNTAIVGGTFDHEGDGAAWVFTRSGSKWTQQGPKLTGVTPKAFFGSAVALSADGDTALIGAELDTATAGAAYVFVRSGSTWTDQSGKLTPSDPTGPPEFGSAAALSADGNTALIGGVDDGNKGLGPLGAAWVFTRTGSTWKQQGLKLTGGEESGFGAFGGRVALSGDGNTALIGGSSDKASVGAAWAFTRTGETWTQQGPKLTGTGEIGAGTFGTGVALSADGNTAMIGAEKDNEEVGAAWMFTRSGSTWTQQGSKITGTGEVGKGGFGNSVALSATAGTALVGARGDNEFIGAALVFAPPPPPQPAPIVKPPVTPAPGKAPTITGLSQTHRVWREHKQLASFARSAKPAPTGTTFRFALDQPAAVSFSFRHLVTGRKAGHKCVAQTKRNRSAKPCTRPLSAGALRFNGHAGANSVRFAGFLSRASRLPVGRYQLVVVAKDTAGQSLPASLAFTITG